MPRPTAQMVADVAEVSLATADRALNGRAHVSARTRSRVLQAARQLGYLQPEEETPALRPVRLLFLLPSGTNAFIAELANQVTRQAGDLRGVSAEVETMAVFEPAKLAERLFALKGRYDGIGVLALDHPMVREACRQLVAAGTHIVTVASDVTGVDHAGYIGIDNTQSGRLAGYMMGRFVPPPTVADAPPAKVAFFAGSLIYRGHQQREMGFREILGQEFPHLSILVRHEMQEDRARARNAVIAVLTAHPDLRAIYSAGGGTAGIVAGLEEAGKARQVVLIAHDLTRTNRAHLLSGAVDAIIDQNARAEIAEALARLTARARAVPHSPLTPQLQVILRENLPEG